MDKCYILGISCFYHDSAACLLRDGRVIAAAQEERFTRKKHDPDFPVNSIRWCLDDADISIKDICLVAFYGGPSQRFKRIFHKNFHYKGRFIFVGHSRSRAASAFYPSPFNEAVILILGGSGNNEPVLFGIGKRNKIELTHYLEYPHSLGALYSAFTYYAGFKINSGEYKLMGLAPYGKPKYKQLILDKIVCLNKDGSFKLNLRYFNFQNKHKLINRRFESLFGLPARVPESEISRHYMDIAASAQAVAEEILLKVSRYVYKRTGMNKLCLAGEVALNCVGNSKVLRNGPFDDIWIQPASSDAGAAL
ncbi:MAG: carbamoyltransferase N-terminal domain-containing protein, partial [Candidatus Omnitrophota bacterium]